MAGMIKAALSAEGANRLPPLVDDAWAVMARFARRCRACVGAEE
jgi:hypothetical protein